MLTRELGSDNIDYRLRNAEFSAFEGVRWLGTSIASLTQVQRALVVGSNLRKEHPLFAQRIRQAVRKGAALSVITSSGLMHGQIFVFFILTVAAAESAIGLALLVLLFRNKSNINVDELNSLKG